MRGWLWGLLLCSVVWGSEERCAREIFAHLKVHDPHAAVQVGKKWVEAYPQSTIVRMAYLQALAEKGDEGEVFQEWRAAEAALGKERQALETLAWSVLKKGELSSQIHIHLASLIGASLTHDVRATPMLVSAMRSSNALFRLFGVRFAAHLGDGVLQEELARLLEEERVWFVRQEVIQAIGQLRIMSLKGALIRLIGNPKLLAEERAGAILALVHLFDGVRKEDVQKLATSSRSGLRLLACALIGYYDLHEEVGLLRKMVRDTSPEVRASGLRTLGLLQEKIDFRSLKVLLKDSHPEVSITAAWVMSRQGTEDEQEEAVGCLQKWLNDIHPKWRWMAAVQLPLAGPKAIPFLLTHLKSHEDPFVRANLALGLLGQREHTEEATRVLDEFLKNEEVGRLMWDEWGSMRMVVPTQVAHIEQIQNYPKMVDQLTRLDLLNLLCILKYPHAEDSVKAFMQKETWSVTGAAAQVLLQEGDEEALLIIAHLLDDPNPHLRVQAALLLATYGNDPRALRVLQDAYPDVNRDTKMAILEAIGHIGGPDAIPFLITILREPFQLLRVIAASSLAQCLYN